MIGACKSNSASYCEWSADDRKLITAILTPRLRVDNCFKVFSYTGVLLHKMDFKHTELYEAVWLNTREYEGIPGRGLSPGRKKGANEVKKFMSFGESLNLDSFTGGGIGVEKQS